MGHFGKRPIRVAWFALVMPALVLNYFGQGALLLRDPSAVENPFFLMAPQLGALPLVVLATAATVIASQALISGAFSVTKQAIQLGYLPRLRIEHTSVRETGQIYVPVRQLGPVSSASCSRSCCSGSSSNAGRGLRHRGDDRHADHHVMTFFVVRYALEVPAGRCASLRDRLLLRRSTSRSSRPTCSSARRRLVPAR